MKYNIRKAILEDAKEIVKVKRKVWETTYRGIYPDKKIDEFNFCDQEAKFESIINNPQIDLYVVCIEGDIIGYISFGEPYRKYKNYEQEIGLLYILKEYQRIGIGKELFNVAYNSIKEKGYNTFFISCNKYNYGAQKFYEKNGGKVVEISENKEDKSQAQIKYHYYI